MEPATREELLRELVKYMSEGVIGVPTFNISVNLLKNFTNKSIKFLEMYPTEHMTMVFEFEKGDHYLSIENGKDTLGYFYELDKKVEGMYDEIDGYNISTLLKNIRKIVK
jgi:hypothetical protein